MQVTICREATPGMPQSLAEQWSHTSQRGSGGHHLVSDDVHAFTLLSSCVDKPPVVSPQIAQILRG